MQTPPGFKTRPISAKTYDVEKRAWGLWEEICSWEIAFENVGGYLPLMALSNNPHLRHRWHNQRNYLWKEIQGFDWGFELRSHRVAYSLKAHSHSYQVQPFCPAWHHQESVTPSSSKCQAHLHLLRKYPCKNLTEHLSSKNSEVIECKTEMHWRDSLTVKLGLPTHCCVIYMVNLPKSSIKKLRVKKRGSSQSKHWEEMEKE